MYSSSHERNSFHSSWIRRSSLRTCQNIGFQFLRRYVSYHTDMYKLRKGILCSPDSFFVQIISGQPNFFIEYWLRICFRTKDQYVFSLFTNRSFFWRIVFRRTRIPSLYSYEVFRIRGTRDLTDCPIPPDSSVSCPTEQTLARPWCVRIKVL